MKRGASGSLDGPGGKRSKRGLPTIKSSIELQKHFGSIKLKGSFPTTFAAFYQKGTPRAASTFDSFTVDRQTKTALLQLLSRSRTHVRYLANAGAGAKKYLHVFYYHLLAACRHGNLIISAEGLDGEQRSEDAEDSGNDDEEGDDEDTDSAGRYHASIRQVQPDLAV